MSCCHDLRALPGRGSGAGVWYRDSTRRQAEALGIRGHAVNLPDGSVEVVACGGDDDVRALQEWLWQGPPAARVDNVHCQPVGLEPPDGFTIG